MLEIEKRINGNGGPELGIKTNEGEFIISYENGSLYIGCFETKYNSLEIGDSLEFNISKEHKSIYDIFSRFIEKSNAELFGNSDIYVIPNFTTLMSDDYEKNETSFVTFEKEKEQIKIVFDKSKSSNKLDSYFVAVKNAALTTPKNTRLSNLFTELYYDEYKQMVMEGIDQLEVENIPRVRTNK